MFREGWRKEGERAYGSGNGLNHSVVGVLDL